MILLFVLLFSPLSFSLSFDCAVPHPTLGYSFKPGCEGKGEFYNSSHYAFRINKMGLRAKDFGKKTKYRIMVVGDSLTVDYGENGAVVSFEKELRARFPQGSFEVVNASVPGYSVMQMYLFLPKLLKEYQPDAVIYNSNFASRALLDQQSVSCGSTLNEKGLVTKIVPCTLVWPLSPDLGWRVFSWFSPEHRHKVRGFAEGLHVLVDGLKLGLRILLQGREQATTEIFTIRRGHLRAIQEMVKATSADFFLLNFIDKARGEKNYQPREKQFSWYQAETFLYFLPFQIVSEEQWMAYKRFLREEFPGLIDLAWMERPKDSTSAHGVAYNPSSKNAIGRQLAVEMIPFLEKRFGQKAKNASEK